MRYTKWLPEPLQRFVRQRMTIHIYTYGFRPSRVIEKQTFEFRVSGRELTVCADHRTALYDMITEVVDYDAYQLREIQWDTRKEHQIIDIGANVGVAALVLAQIPGAKVTCYEPDPENCVFLIQNVETNSATNVKVIQAAVANLNGTVEFQTDEESTGGHIARTGTVRKGRKIKVAAVTLQRVLNQFGDSPVDLLKCDCEGGEYEIVDQITPELARRILNISIEVHDLDPNHSLE
jgi:FkbM family methyltransferase